MGTCVNFCCNASLSDSYLDELAMLSLGWKSCTIASVSRASAFHRGYRLAKRCFDLLGAGFISILFFSPFLTLLILSKYMIVLGWHTPGPLFLLSHRVGKDGCKFTMFKLRTMPTDIHVGGRKWGDHWDTKIFGRWGRFLRTSKLDELPQLGNVLLGQMSLVGPRPLMPITCEIHSLYFPDLRQRVQNTLPGITGTGQLKIFTARPRDVYRRYRLDMFYIQHQSLSYDISILLRTAKLWIRLMGEATQELFAPVEGEHGG